MFFCILAQQKSVLYVIIKIEAHFLISNSTFMLPLNQCSLMATVMAIVLFIHINNSFAQVNYETQNMLFNSQTDVVRLDFSTTPPTPHFTGIIGSYEAITHYEDGNGNLIFWFNSNGVYNANGDYMEGSWGILADASSAEICIAPHPTNPDLYYIFYNLQTCSSLHYAVVDMTLNGGLGDVSAINVLIDDGDYAEGLEIVRIPESNNYWLLAYNCGVGFTKTLIADNDIGQPQLIYEYDMPVGGFDGRGELDFHGNRIAMAFAWSNEVFTANFEPTFGNISNPITLDDPAFNDNPFGVEFSPDGTKLYISLWYVMSIDNLFQYDFASEQLTGFMAVENNGATFVSGLGQIELGPDGRLYVIQDGGDEITVITNPNELGNDITFSSVPIDVNTGLGISDPIQSNVFNANINTVAMCAGAGEVLSLEAPSFDENAIWAVTNEPDIPIHVGNSYSFTMTSDFAYIQVQSVADVGGIPATVLTYFTINPLAIVDAGPDQIITEGATTTMNATINDTDETYFWYPIDGITHISSTISGDLVLTTEVTPSATTTYYLQTNVSGMNDCTVIDSVTITVQATAVSNTLNTSSSAYTISPNPAVNYIDIQTVIPQNSTFALYNTSGKCQLKHSLSTTQQRINVQDLTSGIYLYTINNNTGIVEQGKIVIQ